MTVLRSFWVLVWAKNGDKVILGASAIMESSMYNALARFLTVPLKYHVKVEWTDLRWEVLADVMVNMHRKRIVVLMQDERPKEIDEWDGSKIEVDMRNPDLLDTFRRQEKGFKRIPSLVNFGD